MSNRPLLALAAAAGVLSLAQAADAGILFRRHARQCQPAPCCPPCQVVPACVGVTDNPYTTNPYTTNPDPSNPSDPSYPKWSPTDPTEAKLGQPPRKPAKAPAVPDFLADDRP